MAENSAIQWTDATWNPHSGCHKVSAGCKNCYAERIMERYGRDFKTVARGKTTFNSPLKWKEPRMIFTCSMSDFFIEEADEWRSELWDIIRQTHRHTYQILTKRPERILEHLPDDWGEGYDHVWLGVSGENVKRIVERVTVLLTIPAKVRFLSAEPLLESITYHEPALQLMGRLDWIIAGGESGSNNQFRQCEIEWLQGVIKIGEIYSVPIFIKQLGSRLAKQMGLKDWHGGDIDEFPASLRIREFPKTKILTLTD